MSRAVANLCRAPLRGGLSLSLAMASLLTSPLMPLCAHAAISGPVKIESGQLAGIKGIDPSVTVFKGIPYAAPPIGDLRWRAPQPVSAWQGVKLADQFGAICPQESRPGDQTAMDENCLTANVWTAAKSAKEHRPVLVWIYGGAFAAGSGSQSTFDGEGLARKGVIVVTFNYRVGALGFLATPELSQESGHNASGNYGLLDDIAMLQWVKKNIAAFGGDPDQVTIAGQSAGAGSCGFLSMSPLAKGLFKRAILESHARYSRDLELRYLSVSLRQLASAESAGTQFAAERGAHSLAELRAMPWQKLIVSGNMPDNLVDTGSPAKPPLFRPVVDGWVLPHGYSETYALGGQNNVSIIAGNNKDETGAVPDTAFAALRAPGANQVRPGSPHVNVTLADFQAAAKAKFGDMSDEFLKLYPAADDDEAAHQSNTAARDNSRISTYMWGTDWTKSVKLPVYTYFWTHAMPGPGHDMRGAFHGSEINYVFNNLYATDAPWTDEDRAIADKMSSYWANFIKTGNPNGQDLPLWPVYDPSKPRVMALGDQWGPIPVADEARIDFWKRFFAKQDAW
jgi:para-nitrobenzyl esterase